MNEKPTTEIIVEVDGPTKAYLIERIVENRFQSLVYADSVEDAKRRWLDGEYEWYENTGADSARFGRTRREPDEDLR